MLQTELGLTLREVPMAKIVESVMGPKKLITVPARSVRMASSLRRSELFIQDPLKLNQQNQSSQFLLSGGRGTHTFYPRGRIARQEGPTLSR